MYIPRRLSLDNYLGLVLKTRRALGQLQLVLAVRPSCMARGFSPARFPSPESHCLRHRLGLVPRGLPWVRAR